MSVLTQFTIYGQPHVKKNNQKTVWTGRYFKKIDTPAYKEWHNEALKQLKLCKLPAQIINEPVNMQCIFYMKTKGRVDLSALYEGIQDTLVEFGVLTDDYWGIVAGHDGSRVRFDKENPRMEIIITKMSGAIITGYGS